MSNVISIITPLHNAEQFIAQAIESVLAQSYQDWEMIIVDDCSTDSSASIVKSLVKKDARIKLIGLNENSGAAVARNTGIDTASGRYIAFLDSDDLWLPQKLEMQISFMRLNQVAFTFTAYEIIDKTGLSLNRIVDCKSSLSVNYSDMLRKKCTMGCSTIMLERSLVGKMRMPNLRTGQDYAFWLMLLSKGNTATCLPKPLTKYRVTPGSISRNKYKKALRQWQIYREYEQLGLAKSTYCFLHYAFQAVFR